MALQGLTVDIQPQTAGTQKSVRDARHAIDRRGRHPTEQYFRRLLGYRRDAQIAHLEALVFCRGDLRQPLGIKRLKGHAPGLWIAKVVPQPIGDFSVHGAPPVWLVRDESGWDGSGWDGAG